MFAGLGGAEGELVVHAVRQDDVNDVDGRIIDDLVEGLVGINLVLGEAVFLAPFHALFRRAGDHGGELAVPRLQQRRGDLVGAERTQSDERPAEFLSGWRSIPPARDAKGREGRSECGFDERTALEFHGDGDLKSASLGDYRGQRSSGYPKVAAFTQPASPHYPPNGSFLAPCFTVGIRGILLNSCAPARSRQRKPQPPMLRTIFASLALTAPLSAATRIFQTFEGDGFDGWQAEGEAFGMAPSPGKTDQMDKAFSAYSNDSLACVRTRWRGGQGHADIAGIRDPRSLHHIS